jgi:hypothetical protein
MRYTSSPQRYLVALALMGSAASVLVSWALSAAEDRNLLPVIGGLNGPLNVLFLLLPAAVTVVFGASRRYSRGALWGAAFLALISTAALAWIVWIGWILVVCGLQDNACFD